MDTIICDAEVEQIIREIEADPVLQNVRFPPELDAKIRAAIQKYEKEGVE